MERFLKWFHGKIPANILRRIFGRLPGEFTGTIRMSIFGKFPEEILGDFYRT